MKFRVIHQKTPSGAHSPYQVIEQTTGQGVGWINRFLDREYVRRLADTSLYSYAHSLLHFVRWWESVHHTGDISREDLTESTLLDYVRFQSSLRTRAFCRHHQRPRRLCRSCHPQRVPGRNLSGRAGLPADLPAPQTDGPGPSRGSSSAD